MLSRSSKMVFFFGISSRKLCEINQATSKFDTLPVPHSDTGTAASWNAAKVASQSSADGRKVEIMCRGRTPFLENSSASCWLSSSISRKVNSRVGLTSPTPLGSLAAAFSSSSNGWIMNNLALRSGLIVWCPRQESNLRPRD